MNSLEQITVSLTRCICSQSLFQFTPKHGNPHVTPQWISAPTYHLITALNCTGKTFLRLCHSKTPSTTTENYPTYMCSYSQHQIWPLWEAQDKSVLSCFWFFFFLTVQQWTQSCSSPWRIDLSRCGWVMTCQVGNVSRLIVRVLLCPFGCSLKLLFLLQNKGAGPGAAGCGVFGARRSWNHPLSIW